MYSTVLGEDSGSPHLSSQALSCNSYINGRQIILSGIINIMVQIDLCCILATLLEGCCYGGCM